MQFRTLYAAAMVASAATLPVDAAAKKPLTMSTVLAASSPADWREPDPENTLYLDLASGRVMMELAPRFAPKHVANIKALVREGYFDGLSINRSQENYVVQWGDAEGNKPISKAAKSLPPEFAQRINKGLPFTRLPDADGYAPQVGFSDGFHAARNLKTRQAWLAHCNAALGVGRDVDVASGGGAELYVVIGHAPRHLDRNITLAGRVIKGMELLSTLPRGTGPLGFYEKAEQRVPIERMRVAADVPESERAPLEILRTDTATFKALVESRRNRRDEWYKVPAGHVELCNVPIPVRERVAATVQSKH